MAATPWSGSVLFFSSYENGRFVNGKLIYFAPFSKISPDFRREISKNALVRPRKGMHSPPK